jgi:putative hydrolase of the HAD superfamily
VFYRKRPFGPDEFKTFLFDQSQPYPETLEFVGELARSNKCLMATLNNESFELNEHRIRKFNLRDYFSVFFASCYLGVRKPDPKFYRLAKEITQRETDECLFIDDRELNVESAERAGMRAIRYQNPTQLREELIHYGVL